MAKITITVTDTELADNTYKVDFAAEGAQIDAGQATAAYFTGYYLHSLVGDEGFITGCAEFGRSLVETMVKEAGDTCPIPVAPAVAVLTLADKDLETGRYIPTLEFAGGDMNGEHLPTAAQVVGLYMRNLLHSMDFQKACWQFAEDMIRDNDMAHIANAEYGPADNDENNNPATSVA